jgi:Fuc2NAc and GlcNAc transferase
MRYTITQYELAGAALVAFVAVFVLTEVLRRTIASSMLDHPNERSSHSRAVPRGGGAALVLVVLCVIGWSGLSGRLDRPLMIAFLGGGLLVAISGWRDDRSPISVRARLCVHFAAAAWTVAWLGGFPMLDVGTRLVHLSVAGSVIAVLAIVWSVNLFNFMDGIDGIAGTEALMIGAIGGFLLLDSGAASLGMISIVTSAAALGFLVWNWHPARIFMGDVGSSFLGFIFAALAVASENSRAVPALVWLILGAVFLGDATITLARRVRRGHWSEPHRTHAYQRAVQAGRSHAAVATAVGALNCVLGLVAVVVTRQPRFLVAGVATAVVVVVVAYVLVGREIPYPSSSAAN